MRINILILLLFLGDIVLTADQAEEIYERSISINKRRIKRKFIGSSVRRWDSREPIVYSFDGSHSKSNSFKKLIFI